MEYPGRLCEGSKGEKVIDFQQCNLHVMSYSVPVERSCRWRSSGRISLHFLIIPDAIPYRTSYYEEDWGFCLSHRDYLQLDDGLHEVFIDSDLDAGSLTYGELYLGGEEGAEILISCHACHPSLCNDNLSGVGIAALLAKQIGLTNHRYSYRFLFIPGTIGAITWLALNEDRVPSIKHGLVLTGLGDSGNITYKKSRPRRC